MDSTFKAKHKDWIFKAKDMNEYLTFKGKARTNDLTSVQRPRARPRTPCLLSDKDRIEDVTFMYHADTKDLTFRTDDTTKDLTSKAKTTIKDLKYQGHNKVLDFQGKGHHQGLNFQHQCHQQGLNF